MSWRDSPRSARSAMISPITLANLKPWPEQGEVKLTWGWRGWTSMMKWWSGVLVNMHCLSDIVGPLPSGK